MFGANPALIDAGPGRQLRILSGREDIARDILKACNEEQKKNKREMLMGEAIWIQAPVQQE